MSVPPRSFTPALKHTLAPFTPILTHDTCVYVHMHVSERERERIILYYRLPILSQAKYITIRLCSIHGRHLLPFWPMIPMYMCVVRVWERVCAPMYMCVYMHKREREDNLYYTLQTMYHHRWHSAGLKPQAWDRKMTDGVGVHHMRERVCVNCLFNAITTFALWTYVHMHTIEYIAVRLYSNESLTCTSSM